MTRRLDAHQQSLSESMDLQRRGFLRGQGLKADATQCVSAMRPPWALRPDEMFTNACTRCGDCVPVCPRQLLRAGDSGFPEISFSAAGCTLCGLCRQACTTGAISSGELRAAFEWRVAVDSHCLSQRGIECRVCGEVCEAQALHFVPARGGIAQLQIDADACTGCGECVSRCPSGAIAMS